jgi:hypothetical protein
VIVQTDVAYVRLDDGSVAKVAGGDEIPENAAADHVAGLKAAGVLGEAPQETPKSTAPADGKGRRGTQGS